MPRGTKSSFGKRQKQTIYSREKLQEVKKKKKMDNLQKQKLQIFIEEKTDFYQKSMSRNNL